jgi:hypothetical protein
MCGGKTTKQGCQKPENLKGKPQDCSPEQVKKCHGDAKTHPCATGEAARKECKG